jgi:tellurite methyltransferase
MSEPEATLLRAITGFHQDEHQDWVAELSCGHNQHVRHKPPFWSRPWVLTEQGRTEKLGESLPCILCERLEMPAGFAPYKRTADFTATTVPAALTANHSTKRGVWALLHVTQGTVRYVVEPPIARDVILVPGTPGVIVAEIPHRVAPDADAIFYVEFHRRGAT